MAVQSYLLLDAAEGFVADPCQITPADVGGAARDYRIVWRRLRGGLSDGVDLLEIDNGRFAFSVIPTRGLGIWKAQRGDLTLGWKSPVAGPVHPQFVPLSEPSGLGWLDGFDELLVRCGLESNGAPEFDAATGRLRYPLHGRIANRPAHRLSVSIDGDSGRIEVVGEVDETRFHLWNLRLTSRMTTTAGLSGVAIRDEVTNRAGTPGEFQMLYHVNFGLPLLDAGARVVLPAETIVPRNSHAAAGIDAWDRYVGPTPGFQEQVYFFRLLGDAQGRTRALLKNQDGSRGASVTYDVRQLPCFSVWKDTMAAEDGYVTGLEPATNFPNPRSFEGRHGRCVRLAPGETATFDLGIEAHAGAAEVAAAEQAVEAIRAGRAPTIHAQPLADWCAS